MKLAQYLTLATFTCVSTLVFASSINGNPWDTRLTFNGQTGSTSSGQLDLLQPLWGTDDRLLFFNASGQLLTNSAQEYNLGLGYRQLIDGDQYILGGYGYYDRITSNYGSVFNEATVGGELLSNTWNYRANAYIPYGQKSDVYNNYYDPIVAGHSVSVSDETTTEQTMPGFDVEAGRPIPFLPALSTYLGYYHFGTPSDEVKVNGARARLEYQLNHNVVLTASEQYDGNQHNSALVGVRISFGGVNSSSTAPALQQRMEDYVIHDEDIILPKSHAYSNVVDSHPYYYVDNAAPAGGDGTYEHPFQTEQQAQAAAGSNSVIYTYQGNSTYNLAGQMTLQPGQILTGSGGNYYFKGVEIFGASGTPILNGRINVASGDTLSNFILTGANSGQNIGIYGSGVSNVTLDNITVTDFSGTAGVAGQAVTTSTNATSNNGTAGQDAYGVQLTNSHNVNIDQVTVSNITGGNGGNGGSMQINLPNSGTITTVTGSGGNGGNAIGMDLAGSSSVAVNNVNVNNITAGNGGTGGYTQISGTPSSPTSVFATLGSGGAGGNASGIDLVGSSSSSIMNAAVTNILGGNSVGSSAYINFANFNVAYTVSSSANPGAGGNATGIDVSNTFNTKIAESSVNNVTGGNTFGGAVSSIINGVLNSSLAGTASDSGTGGQAVGIAGNNANQITLGTTAISQITGGSSTGGDALISSQHPVGGLFAGGFSSDAGNAVGVNLTGALNVNVNLPSMHFNNLTGGSAVNGIGQSSNGAGADGLAYNILLP